MGGVFSLCAVKSPLVRQLTIIGTGFVGGSLALKKRGFSGRIERLGPVLPWDMLFTETSDLSQACSFAKEL